jgi:signal transduction histidine kinase
LKISSKLSSIASVINWVCLEASIDNRPYFKMSKGSCSTSVFQQKQEILIPQANNTKIEFTIRLPREVEYLFSLFLLMQVLLIATLIHFTKKSIEEKRSSEIRINKIARQMSHDIRSPLATLNTIISSMASIPVDDIKLLNNSIDRINTIANHLLMDTQKDSSFVLPLPCYETAELGKELEDILDAKRLEFSKNSNVKIYYEKNNEYYYAFLDVHEFKRSISNLINNAVESQVPNFLVTVKIEISHIEDHKIKITIEDNGKGIGQAILEKLGKQELTTKKNGNGLGLLHTYENVFSWNGSVAIESGLNEQGTKVVILLPEVLQESEIILLLDDDELVRLTWQSMAKKLNKKLIAIASPIELKDQLVKLKKDSDIYIDSFLGNGIKGEDIALDLHLRGYKNIYITSGYEKNHFQHLTFLKGIKDKSPPWNIK